MERGDVNQMSFGFSLRPNGQDWAKDDAGQVIRTLKRVRLFDVSPVTYPAYPQTDVAVRELRSWSDSQGTSALAQQEAALQHIKNLRMRLDLCN